MTAIKNLVALLVLTVLTSGVLGWFLFQARSDNDAMRLELGRVAAEHLEALRAKDDELQRTLTAQAAQHQKAIDTMNAEHEQSVAGMRQDERKRLAAAAKEFENIFEGNKATLSYINTLEDKVRAGQELSKTDVERLTIITTGLGYLKKQYQKPMQEFTELQAYFEAQASKKLEKPKGNLFKRMFSKDFRAAEKEYERSEGARQAFEQAQGVFTQVYAKAQKSMANVSLDADAQIKKLQDYVDEKRQQKPEDLSSFFDQARKALKTHQEVLDFEPDSPTGGTKPQP